MNSSKVSNNQLDPPTPSSRAAWDYWTHLVTPEPISNHLRETIRQDLRKHWYSCRLGYFRFWTHTNWARIDSEKILLDGDLNDMDERKAQFCCNRPSAFYWLPSLQEAGDGKNFCRPTPTYIFASIFGEWYRQYDNQPNLEFGHFLANPIRVTDRGPSTISGILKAHLSLLEKAESTLREVTDQGEPHLVPHEDNARRYVVHPLYRSLIMLVDRNELSDRLEEYRRPDRYIRLRDIAHFQSIIVARTGAEEHLSAPISFESLHKKALPLDRTDFDGKPNVDVIRVNIPDAVRFVIDLEKREDSAVCGKKTAPGIDWSINEICEKVFPRDRDHCYDSNTWADQHIIAAEKHGYEYCVHTATSIRRVQAEMHGDLYKDLSPMWFAPKWIDYEGELGEQW